MSGTVSLSPGRERSASSPADPAQMALAAKLTVLRDGAAVVREVEVELLEGEALGVVGRNGAGKTTLIHGLMGMLATQGTVRYFGADIAALPTFRRATLGMALVPQGRRLFGSLTVAENLRTAKLSGSAGGPEIDPFELFPGLRELLERPAGVLSGGQQQQVAIARALLRRPRLLFLDEPTEGLSPGLVQEVLEALRHLRESGLTIVLAEQHIRVIEEICTEVVPLRPGDASARAIATSEFRGSGFHQLTNPKTTQGEDKG